MMRDPRKDPDLDELTIEPGPEDFQSANVEIPKEGVVPIPGEAV